MKPFEEVLKWSPPFAQWFLGGQTNASVACIDQGPWPCTNLQGGACATHSGVVREIEFLRPTDVSILSERRAVPPYGLAGGEPGVRGQNLLLPAGGGAGPGAA